MDELKIKLTEDMISRNIQIEYPKYRVYVNKSSIGNTEDEKLRHNLHATARTNINVKNFVVSLVNNGFFLIKHESGISVFEKYDNPKLFKNNFTDKNIQIFRDLFYTIEKPKIESDEKKLLVCFSSVADHSYNASISRRNFFKNFENIGKYIPHDCYILRVSDIGSVVGSFYLNSIFDNKREDTIQELLSYILKEKHINKKNVVLYGTSKGGTGALYHGILGGYKVISVDPIVSDEYHEQKYNDTHFTQGTFVETKQEKFRKLIKNNSINTNINIIYSENSPIYGAINTTVKNNDKNNAINYINVVHPNIKNHPDVGPNTINIVTMLINGLFYELTESKSLSVNLTNNQKYSPMEYVVSDEESKKSEPATQLMTKKKTTAHQISINESIESFQKRFDSNDTLPRHVYIEFSIVLRSNKDYDKAQKIIEQGILIHPDYQQLYIALGVVHNEKKEWLDASKCFYKAQTFNERFKLLNYKRYILALENLNDIESLEKIILEALTLYDDKILNDKLLHTLAIKNLYLKNYALSEKYFNLLFVEKKEEHVDIFLLEKAKELKKIDENNKEGRFGLINTNLEPIYYPPYRKNAFLYLPEMMDYLFENIEKDYALMMRDAFDIMILTRRTNKIIIEPEDEFFLLAVKNLCLFLSDKISRFQKIDMAIARNLCTLALLSKDFNLYKLLRFRSLNIVDSFSLLKYQAELGELSLIDTKNVEITDGCSFGVMSLYNNRLDNYKRYYNDKELSRYNEQLNSYLNGKTVAIVGPVNVETDNGAEIDSYDVVIRFNYNGLSNFNNQMFGTKTNLSYYIEKDFNRICETKNGIKNMNSLDFFCIEEGTFNRVNTDTVETNIALRLPVHKKEFNPLLYGAPNAVQKALLDLFRYDCQSIKVFNANLWVDNSGTEHYRKNTCIDAHHLALHDLVSNFLFTKRLFDKGLFEADDVLKEVLSMTKEEYLDAIIEACNPPD